MQTFLPYKSFIKSASVLDNKRLGKQRVEVLQILKTLTGESKGWQNHPAVKMWKGYEGALAYYGYVVCQEWKSRGFKDSCEEKIKDLAVRSFNYESGSFPEWLGNEDFHNSHKSNLLRKDKEFYSKYEWNITDDLPYIWPVNNETTK